MKNFSYFDQFNHTIYNKVGYWQGGEDVVIEGKSLINDLMGSASYMQVHVLNSTGKWVERNVADWLEVCFMGLSYPDARIWCNQIAAYTADQHCSVVGAAAAAILSADSRAYGGSFARQLSMDWQQSAFKKYQAGASMEDVVANAKHTKGKPMIVGFARPIEKSDERLEPFHNIQKQLNIPQGRYLKFAFALSEYLFEHHNLSINCGGYASAFLLDQGFTPEEGYQIQSFSVISGAIASFRNQQHKPANSFLPMKCDDVKYGGHAPRLLPD